LHPRPGLNGWDRGGGGHPRFIDRGSAFQQAEHSRCRLLFSAAWQPWPGPRWQGLVATAVRWGRPAPLTGQRTLCAQPAYLTGSAGNCRHALFKAGLLKAGLCKSSRPAEPKISGKGGAPRLNRQPRPPERRGPRPG